MVEELERKRLEDALRNCASALTVVHLASVMQTGDTRYEPTNDLLLRAVWDAYWDLGINKRDEVVHVNLDEFLRRVEGRVLTVVDSVFPAGSQCEAIKGLMRQRIWAIWQESRKPESG